MKAAQKFTNNDIFVNPVKTLPVKFDSMLFNCVTFTAGWKKVVTTVSEERSKRTRQQEKTVATQIVSHLQPQVSQKPETLHRLSLIKSFLFFIFLASVSYFRMLIEFKLMFTQVQWLLTPVKLKENQAEPHRNGANYTVHNRVLGHLRPFYPLPMWNGLQIPENLGIHFLKYKEHVCKIWNFLSSLLFLYEYLFLRVESWPCHRVHQEKRELEIVSNNLIFPKISCKFPRIS